MFMSMTLPLGISGFAIVLAASSGACNSTAHGADADDGTYNCATETRADTFVVGLEKPGEAGKLDFKLLEATPAPPARGDNTWKVQVNSMAAGVAGNPVGGATMTVTPFMPDHAHGTPIQVIVTPMTTTGDYQLSPVNMWMPGLWETTMQVQAGGVSDTVVYRFCIPS